MTETFVPGAIETGANVNTLGEASEQDMVRVSESMQKAKQMGAQIQGDQKKNAHLASFLTFLFGAISDEEIRSTSVELFSRPDQSNMGTTLSIFEMLALFLPLYVSKVEETGIAASFEGVHYHISLTLESYLGYVQLLYQVYPLYHKLDKDTLSSLIATILLYHGIVVLEEGKTLIGLMQQIRPALG